mmetsp:Transcript_59418/g.128969  ORF Transcript_59418/g.128969 Transcript_59418/m.128969 type:complete len:325 (-) Transcript_59418:82-1056(-)
MQCDPTKLSTPQVIGCEYTKAYLRAFPLLGISVTLAISLRTMLQQRLYYGLLKAGGLLDFRNVEVTRDPLFLMLLVSLLHAIAHFALKLTDGLGHFLEEVQDVATDFVVPFCIFMVFFYMACDLEATLVPLNKYYEEDPEYARSALANVTYMEEEVVRHHIVKRRDVVGDALADEPSIDATYRALIKGYPDAKLRDDEPEEGFFGHCQIRRAMWPGVLLVDARLEDAKSVEFRRIVWFFLVLCTPVQLALLFLYVEQAVYQDLFIDVYQESQIWDSIGAVVMILHAAVVVWILSAQWWMMRHTWDPEDAEIDVTEQDAAAAASP